MVDRSALLPPTRVSEMLTPLEALVSALSPKIRRRDILRPGTIVAGEYKVTSFLGEGGFGFTYKAKDPNGETVALKECYPKAFCRRNGTKVGLKSATHTQDATKLMEQFVLEAKVLADLRHPNIVSGGQLLRDNGTFYLAMQYVDGCSLGDLKKSFFSSRNARTCRSIASQLLSAIDYLHRKGYLHNDISPDNILVGKDNVPVLIDFGTCSERTDEAYQADTNGLVVVKPGYSPPEFYLEEAMKSPESDIYSLGATLYQLVTKTHPPEAMERMTHTARQRPDPLAPIRKRGKPDWQNFVASIEQALRLMPNQRYDTVGQWKAYVDG